MADYQLRAIFHHQRYGLVEATTKSGKTVGCMVWLTEQAMAGKDGQNFWWCAPIYSQAKIAFRRLKRAIPRHLYTANESELTLTLANGAIMWFKGMENADNLYGEDVFAAVIDEASRVREQSWFAVRSTLTATRGPVRIIGNVKGRKNWFYTLARKAEAGESGMSYAKVTAWDAVEAGILDRSEIDDARRQLPDHVFKELYLAEASEDGSNPFGMDAIARCVAPLSALDPAAWGVDLAKSVDWTVGIGLDTAGFTAAFERWQSPWQETIERVARITAGRPALVDSTGVGDPVLESLQRAGGRFEGFKFSSTSKQQLMEGLAVGIQNEAIHYPDGPIRAELDAFEYEYTRTGVRYSAPSGVHDDCVMALALAWQKLGHKPRRIVAF